MAIAPWVFDEWSDSTGIKLPNNDTHVRLFFKDGQTLDGKVKFVWMCMDEAAIKVVPDFSPENTVDFLPALEVGWEYID